MAELFPEDPKLSQFAHRYSGDGFDPTAIRPVISPAYQQRPKGSNVMQSIEQPQPVQDSPMPVYENSPRPQYLQTTNSPKRPFPEDFENDLNRPRKLARGESPLKGAAGRRLNEQKQARGTPQWQSNAPVSRLFSTIHTYSAHRNYANNVLGTLRYSSRYHVSASCPISIKTILTCDRFLLSIIPRADLYQQAQFGTKFKPDSMVRLLSQINVPDFHTWRTTQNQPPQPQPPQQHQQYDGKQLLSSPPTKHAY